jgi:alpha-tubulin suppressor-like RCC1 family protein
MVFIQVAVGGMYSLVLRNDGVVYSFGANEVGQLGLGYFSSQQLLPLSIDSLNGINIVQLSAGNAHSLILTNRGKVYSFGSSQYQQNGLG